MPSVTGLQQQSSKTNGKSTLPTQQKKQINPHFENKQRNVAKRNVGFRLIDFYSEETRGL